MTDQDLQELLREGITAARARNKALARQKLVQVVKADPNNEMGWFWLASVLDGKEERIKSLQRVLKINPSNQKAREILDRLQAKQTAQEVPPDAGPKAVEKSARGRLAPAAASESGLEKTSFDLDQMFAPVEKALGHYGLSNRQARLVFGGGLVFVVLLCLIILLPGGGGDDGEDDSAADDTAVPTDVAQNVTDTPDVVTTQLPPTEVTPQDTPTPTLTPTITPTETPTETPLPTETPTPPPPAPAEAVGRMVIASGAQSSEPMNQPIFILEPSTNTLTPISPDQSRGQSASLSPDGARFAMLEYNSRFGRFDPVVVTVGNRSSLPLDTLWSGEVFVENIGSPAWAPSNTMLTFTGDAQSGGAGRNLFINFFIPGEGQSRVREVASDGNVSDPAWAPNASRVVYALESSGVTDLYVYEVGAQGITQITRNEATIVEDSPDWSPDESRIAFSGTREGTTGSDIYVMPADGSGEPELLINYGENDINPRWSPDGRFIAFSSDVDGKFDIFLYDLQTDTFYSVVSDSTTWDIVSDWIR